MNTIRFSIITLLLIASSVLFAQEQPPAPGPAPEVKMAEPQRFELPNGLNVILVENHKLPTVVYSLYVDYDAILEGDRAGMRSAMGSILQKGTTNKDEEAFAEAVDMMGAFMNTNPRGAYVSGLSKYRNELGSLMAEALLQPAFSQEAFDREVKQQLSGLAIQNDNPNAIAARVASALNYGLDHPYGEFETEESWKNISLEDCKKFYDAYFKPNVSYLVMVGDLSLAQAEKIAKDNFGGWQRSDVKAHTYSTPKIADKRYVALVDRSNAAQSVISVSYPIELTRADKDIFAARVMNQILGGGGTGRLFLNLREKNGYTYGAYSGIRNDKLVGRVSASASVRTTVTDSAIQEILNEFERIRQAPVSEEELSVAKNYLMGAFARSLEDPQTVANFTLSIDRLGLEKDYYQNYLKNLEAVSIEDVQRVARRFIHPDKALVMVVGKGSEIAESLNKFGEVHYMSNMAEKLEAPKRELPKGLTADNVVSKYLVARGGKANFDKVKDLTMNFEASIMNQPSTLTQKFLFGKKNMMYQELEVGEGLFVQRTVTDGKSGVSFDSQNGRKDLEGKDLEKTFAQADPFSFIDYQTNGYKVELTTMEQVEGKDAFVLKTTNPVGEVSDYYYDAETGFLVKRVTSIENPGGKAVSQTVLLQDYKEVDGIMYPHILIQQVGPQKMTFNLKEVKVNSGLSKKEFPVKK